MKKAGGFALIDLIFVCGVIGLLASIAVPRLMLAKQAAGAASAIGTMRAISSGQLTYALTCGSGFYAPRLTTQGQPPPPSREPFIGSGLGAADTVTKSTYLIQMVGDPFPGAPPTCNGLAAGESAQGYRAAADPTEGTNVRFFATNSNGVIYEHNASLFTLIPEVGEPSDGHILR